MGFIKEFKEFALKGNVVDMAVGVIIGGAFATIINSLIGDVIMPIVGIAGKADFSNLYVPLSDAVRKQVAAAGPNGLRLADARAAGPVLAYGSFITVAVNFFILAFIIFMMVKQINRLKRADVAAAAATAAPPPPAEDIVLLREIRDALKK